MREILFRGKRKDNGEWVEGVYYKQTLFYSDPCEKHYIITSTESLQYDQALDYFEVIPETIGQYTGLTDENGKKIFEGDIVEQTDNVGQKTVYWVVFGMNYGYGINSPSFMLTDYRGANTPFNPRLEVIGNIHDNPELLQNT